MLLSSIEDACRRLRHDLATHVHGSEVSFDLRDLSASEARSFGVDPTDADRFQLVTVTLPSGDGIGGVLARSDEGADSSNTGVLADLVQDAVEEGWRTPWPICPTHRRSMMVDVASARWICPLGDVSTAVGELAALPPIATGGST